MKRQNNLFDKICSLENLHLADQKAMKGKSEQYGVKVHQKNREENIQTLHDILISGEYKTSEYTTFKITDPKEREIFRLPYFPDRITHHAIMNVLQPMFIDCFTANTYSCIKGRGIHAAQRAVEKALKDTSNTTYCLKLDIRKFYPSIDHEILKKLLRRKIKDKDLLSLLDGIIDSAHGLPIGNYLSQYLANFYLTPFDHWIKEQQGVRYCFRYADDIVIFSGSKEYLHQLLAKIREYLSKELNLTIKSNYQIFPVDARGVDFVGYVYYHTHTRLRKGIKKRYARAMAKNSKSKSIPSYTGWASHCKSRHLVKKLHNDRIQ